MATPAPPKHTRVVLAVITTTDELSLACTTSLLKLQQIAAQRSDLALDVHLVTSFLEALNTYVRGDVVIMIDGAVGIPHEFVLGVLDSSHAVVAGVYPTARVDWDRVAKVLHDPSATEPLHHAGNVYNVTPDPGRGLVRYVPIRDVTELKVLAIKSSVLQAMAGPDISYDIQDGTAYLFTHESVFENKLQNVYQTLTRKLKDKGIHIVADLDAPCTLAAPAQFAGCVGMRSAVR
jgi:hypothetical protein